MLIVNHFIVFFLVADIYELPSQEPGLSLSCIDNRITLSMNYKYKLSLTILLMILCQVYLEIWKTTWTANRKMA